VRIVILHFQPLELYPPIQNLLHVLATQKSLDVTAISTKAYNTGFNEFQTPGENVRLLRSGWSGASLAPLKRYWNYIRFNVHALGVLIRERPENVLYFETLSSFPAVLYKLIFKRSCGLYIHYHEYTSVEEYRSGMKMSRFFHSLEKWVYRSARWISHTNEFRLDKFRKDIGAGAASNLFVVPNYPLKSWARDVRKSEKEIAYPVKVVYAGSLSMGNMYTKEFAEWVDLQRGRVLWDIYSHNLASDATRFFEQLKSSWIQVKAGVSYDELAGILGRYDVGVILYKGHILNYVLNAPNKLFEYLACGLDVWFPPVMTGSLPYATQGTFPKVLPVDFGSVTATTPDQLITRSGCEPKNYNLFCENAVANLVNALSAEHKPV
jgi:hypothetical protein